MCAILNYGHQIQFADDLADAEEEINLMLRVLNSSLTKCKLKINSEKTKSMVSNKEIINSNIRERIEQVNEFCLVRLLDDKWQ